MLQTMASQDVDIGQFCKPLDYVLEQSHSSVSVISMHGNMVLLG